MTQTVMHAVVKNVHQQAFEIVQAPKLLNRSQDAVVSLKRRLEHHCSSGQTCIELDLLEVVCLYELRKAVDDVTSVKLVALIDKNWSL
ncbi:hypothetical protein PHMEG_0008460 [Phytophthora megakarya]|uniref:Uncharacterized protein n=1 Tax=Phytophthora megakarya TaxID=4795 RepID=A0A225WIQ4_9STRA|nr:hypothetical protein PHMEG_0008460 [Phytophthora megakarya]